MWFFRFQLLTVLCINHSHLFYVMLCCVEFVRKKSNKRHGITLLLYQVKEKHISLQSHWLNLKRWAQRDQWVNVITIRVESILDKEFRTFSDSIVWYYPMLIRSHSYIIHLHKFTQQLINLLENLLDVCEIKIVFVYFIANNVNIIHVYIQLIKWMKLTEIKCNLYNIMYWIRMDRVLYK